MADDPHAQGHTAALAGQPMCAPAELSAYEAGRWCEGWRVGDLTRRVAALERERDVGREAWR